MNRAVDTEIIWKRVRELNELSQRYSSAADELVRIAQQIEAGE